MSETPSDRADDQEPRPTPRPTPRQSSQLASRDVAEHGPAFAAPEPPVKDLSSQIVLQVARAPGERVTCRRISGNHYRCNWWSAQGTDDYDNPDMRGLTVTTHRVSRSRLLYVTKTDKGLVIRDAENGRR